MKNSVQSEFSWAANLPIYQHIYNTTSHKSIGKQRRHVCDKHQCVIKCQAQCVTTYVFRTSTFTNMASTECSYAHKFIVNLRPVGISAVYMVARSIREHTID